MPNLESAMKKLEEHNTLVVCILNFPVADVEVMPCRSISALIT